MISAAMNEPVSGRIIVKYDRSRVDEMHKIKERFCIAAERLILEQIKDKDIKIKKIRHARPNGIVDLVFEFSSSRKVLPDIHSSLKKIQKTDYGIGEIDIYLPAA